MRCCSRVECVANRVTGPTFCTTVVRRVYITTSIGRGAASGGSQGAVGDRRATICGLPNAVGTGGAYNRSTSGDASCLYSTRHFSITICASQK